MNDVDDENVNDEQNEWWITLMMKDVNDEYIEW